MRVLRWLDGVGEGTTMVGLRWSVYYNGSDVVFPVLRQLCRSSGYYDGWTAVVRVLRWLGSGGQSTTMVGQGRSGYNDGWAAVVRVLRWLGCGGEGTTMVGLRW